MYQNTIIQTASGSLGYGIVTSIANGAATGSQLFTSVPGSSFLIPAAGVWNIDYSVSCVTSDGYNGGFCIYDASDNSEVPGSLSVAGYLSGDNHTKQINLVGFCQVTLLRASQFELRWATGGGTLTICNSTIGTGLYTGGSTIRYTQIA